MRKPQSQPSLAGLTDAEREQLADWVRREEYAVVRDRVNQPRPEGFGLKISEKPLRTLWAKVAVLDLINSRIVASGASGDKKLTLAEFESLGSRNISLLTSASSEKIADVHDTILNTVHDLATSGDNTVTQLRSLQHLADFPARAEIREQRLELDHQKFEHKQEMDTFRKDMAQKRYDFAKETFAFRQQVHKDKLHLALQKPESKTDQSKKEDPLGPKARNWKDVNRRARIMFNISDEESARRRALRKAWREEQAKLTAQTQLEPASDMGGAARAASDSFIEAPCNADFQSVVLPNLTPNPIGTSPAADCPSPIPSACSASSAVKSLPSFPSAESPSSVPSACSAHSALNPSFDSPNLKSEICDLQSKVDSYTIKRAREYWAWRRKISSGYPTDTHPDYITQYRHCPCGHTTPCPTHENEESYGRFPDWFWTRSPHSLNYADCLRSRDLPYRDPKEFLA